MSYPPYRKELPPLPPTPPETGHRFNPAGEYDHWQQRRCADCGEWDWSIHPQVRDHRLGNLVKGT